MPSILSLLLDIRQQEDLNIPPLVILNSRVINIKRREMRKQMDRKFIWDTNTQDSLVLKYPYVLPNIS